MTWYYAEGNQQLGPIDQTQFDALVAAGRIQGSTLVWHAGMASWAPYSTVQPAPLQPEPIHYGQSAYSQQPQPGQFAGAAASPAYGAASRFCVECGTPHAEAEMARYGDSYVCVNCKGLYDQKLREGVRTTATWRYAGFWIRFLAVFLDGIIVGIFNLVVNAVIGVMSLSGTNPADLSPARIALFLLAYLINFAVGASYESFFLAKYGATPGKMACGLRVVRASGAPLTLGVAFGRYFAKLLNMFTLLIGYIIAAFDDQKRALHDRICETRVIYK